MTLKELDDFIEHGEKHISHFIIVFGEEWVRHAIQIASELRHRLKNHEREWVGLTDAEIRDITGVTSADSDWNVLIVHKWIRAIEERLRKKNYE